MKRLIVWHVMDWKLSTFNGHDYKRVAFKNYDGSKGTIYLNLTQNTQQSNWESWDKILKEGNVLDVTMHPNGNVNQFAPFNVIQIKPVNVEV